MEGNPDAGRQGEVCVASTMNAAAVWILKKVVHDMGSLGCSLCWDSVRWCSGA
jgi:hypothetical protein